MHIPALADARQKFEQKRAYTDFLKCCALIMTTKGLHEAAAKAVAIGQPESVWAPLHKAVSAGSTANTTVVFGELFAAFLAQLRAVGAADTIAADAGLRLPIRPGNIAIDVSAITASSPAEGVAKPVSSAMLNNQTFAPTKAVAHVVMTRELIDALTAEGVRALGRAITDAVAIGTDAGFMSAIAAAGSTDASSGTSSDFATILNDLEELLHLVRLGTGSKPYFILPQPLAKALAAKATGAGITTVGVTGGEILGVPVLVSDGQTDGQVTLLDARGLAVALGDLDLRSSDVASVEMTATPTGSSVTPTAATMVNMFQTNSRVLLAEREYAVKVVRPNSAMTMIGVGWGVTGGSPTAY